MFFHYKVSAAAAAVSISRDIEKDCKLVTTEMHKNVEKHLKLIMTL